MPLKILHYRRVDSTNTVALDLAGRATGRDPFLVRADQQSGGRGQHGRFFASPAGGLYCSLVLFPHLDPERLSMVTLAAGVGCCRAMEDAASVSPRLKWPNDLYLSGRKLAGILTETGAFSGTGIVPPVVIGIGMNVNTPATDLPTGPAVSAVSLFEVTGRCFDLDLVLDLVVRRVEEAVRLLEKTPGTLLARWRQRDYLVGRHVELILPGRRVRGQALGLAADGRYRLLDDEGCEHRILAGSLRPVSRTGDGTGP